MAGVSATASPSMKILDRFVLGGVAAASLAMVLVHFSVTLLYVFPLNPLKASVRVEILRYAGTLFAQNWSLFAPLPIHSNFGLFVRCQTRDKRVSGWFDVGSAFVEGLHNQPFGPYVRLVRVPSTAVRNYLGGDVDPDTIKAIETSCRTSKRQGICVERDPAFAESAKVGAYELQGLASAVCADAFPGNVAAVRTTETSSTVRPWSERDAPRWHAKTTTVASTGWMPFRNVAPMHFILKEDKK